MRLASAGSRASAAKCQRMGIPVASKAACARAPDLGRSGKGGDVRFDLGLDIPGADRPEVRARQHGMGEATAVPFQGEEPVILGDERDERRAEGGKVLGECHKRRMGQDECPSARA
jgi:hypothetical protein